MDTDLPIVHVKASMRCSDSDDQTVVDTDLPIVHVKEEENGYS